MPVTKNICLITFVLCGRDKVILSVLLHRRSFTKQLIRVVLKNKMASLEEAIIFQHDLSKSIYVFMTKKCTKIDINLHL